MILSSECVRKSSVSERESAESGRAHGEIVVALVDGSSLKHKSVNRYKFVRAIILILYAS